MLSKQFPNLDWVRRLRNDASGQQATKWNNIALNVRCREACRTGVESPYSLFMNVSGHSYCNVNRKQYKVETDGFLFTRPGDHYDLIIDNLQQTETFNIHINRDFFHDVAADLTATDTQLLDGAARPQNDPYLFTQLYARDAQLNGYMQLLAQAKGKTAFDIALANMIGYLLKTDTGIQQQINALPAVNAAVRAEIYSRLILAKDMIHSHYHREPDLDELCRETAMSKFHFLRMFKAVYGLTPYQYLTRVRMEKACGLLKHTTLPISAISAELGFEYPNSFIKAFQKAYGVSPLQWRKR
jgi:AraC family transcriptional regulator